MCSLGGQKQILDNASATTLPILNKSRFSELSFPLPPLNEQRRIVEKIEALTARSRKAHAALDEIPALLDQFRQSVLAAAFRGDLTADWRAQNPDVEPAEALLERIRVERRDRWEAAELEKMKAKGKVLTNSTWEKKYSDVDSIEQEGLPDLPPGWLWIKLDILIADGPQNGLYLPQSKYGGGTPIVRIDSFQDGWSRSSSELQLVDASLIDIHLYSLQEGDIVINRVNSPSHLGKALLIESRHLPSLFESNMMRLSLVSLVNRSFLEFYLRSPVGRRALTLKAKWSVNQASINQTDVKETLLPLPPLEEQNIIAERVETQLKVMDRVRSLATSDENLLEQIDQSILAKAFRGELVPQDPNDEPAAVLLDRIRAERERLGSGKKRGKAKA